MSGRVDVRARAREDILELADYLAHDDIDVAIRFVEAAQSAFDFLAETPGAGALRDYVADELQRIRMWPIRGFERYLVFYQETDEGVDVIRVLHSARDVESIMEDADEG